MNFRYLWPSSVGFFLMAVIVSFLALDSSHVWIPFSAILIIMGLQTFVTKSSLSSLEARLRQLEAQAAQKAA